MVGRNEPCPCGSGKKYKKCCEKKQELSTETVFIDELERVLQTFYNDYPERKDLKAFLEQFNVWKANLIDYLQEELIQSVVLDDYFFHQKKDIWTGYLKKAKKKIVRPSTIKVLENWSNPTMFVGKITAVASDYFQAVQLLTGETLHIRRESTKPIPEGMHVFAFILPDASDKPNHYLAISTLIFFPTDYNKVFEAFANRFNDSNNKSAKEFMENEHLALWKSLVENGYRGEEFTNFENGVLTQTKSFLESREREATPLILVLEDYLIEQQPSARKEVAIAAGAIRFGQEKGLFESLSMTVKEIAESFGVSPSSLNKYYQDLMSYTEMKQTL